MRRGARRADDGFTVSCIVPVHDVAPFLEEALESVASQTIGFERHVQLVLVDDASTDASADICARFKRRYPRNVVTIAHARNQGVSASRNDGLDAASGEFVAFLDGDDRYDAEAFASNVAFLRAHAADDVDVVANPIRYFGDVPRDEHALNFRFALARVVDLEEEYTYTQLMVHATLIRRAAIGGLRFLRGLRYTEDGEFLHRVLLQKMRYGLNPAVPYNLRVREDGGSAQQRAEGSPDWYRALCVFPQAMAEASLRAHGRVTRYTQQCILYALQWYRPRKIPPALARRFGGMRAVYAALRKVLRHVDDDLILAMPRLRVWLMREFLRIKGGAAARRALSDPLFQPGAQPFWVGAVEEEGGSVRVHGYCNLPPDVGFLAGEPGAARSAAAGGKPCVSMVAEYAGAEFPAALRAREAADVYFLGRRVSQAMEAEFVLPYRGEGEIRLYYALPGGARAPARRRFLYTSRLSFAAGSFVVGDTTLLSRVADPEENGFYVRGKDASAVKAMLAALDASAAGLGDAWLLGAYTRYYELLSSRRVWLFMDRAGSADEGAEYLFRHCARIPDGILKFFVINLASPDAARIAQYGPVIGYGSARHKLLALFAEKFVSSFFEFAYQYPFDAEGRSARQRLFRGLARSRFVYLQHGILKDDLSERLNRLARNVRLFVTAVPMEDRALLGAKYGYRPWEVARAGAPRFDGLYNDPRRVVLFMPTWRSGLHAEGGEGFFARTEYCRRIRSLLNNRGFIDGAAALGYTVVFKPHPRTASQMAAFAPAEGVVVAPPGVPNRRLYAEGDLLITDYSSTQFDFAYLGKPVVYYQFGRHHFDTDGFDYARMGFGEVVADEASLVALVLETLAKKCTIEPKYRARAERFFAFRDARNCERAYRAILRMDANDSII